MSTSCCRCCCRCCCSCCCSLRSIARDLQWTVANFKADTRTNSGFMSRFTSSTRIDSIGALWKIFMKARRGKSYLWLCVDRCHQLPQWRSILCEAPVTVQSRLAKSPMSQFPCKHAQLVVHPERFENDQYLVRTNTSTRYNWGLCWSLETKSGSWHRRLIGSPKPTSVSKVPTAAAAAAAARAAFPVPSDRCTDEGHCKRITPKIDKTMWPPMGKITIDQIDQWESWPKPAGAPVWSPPVRGVVEEFWKQRMEKLVMMSMALAWGPGWSQLRVGSKWLVDRLFTKQRWWFSIVMVNYQRVDQITERFDRVHVQFDHQSPLPICWRPTSGRDHQSNQAWIEFGTEALLNWHCKIPDSYPLINRSSYPLTETCSSKKNTYLWISWTETCSTKIRKFPLPCLHPAMVSISRGYRRGWSSKAPGKGKEIEQNIQKCRMI